MNTSIEIAHKKTNAYLEKLKIIFNHIGQKDELSKSKQTIFLTSLLPEADLILQEYDNILKSLNNPKQISSVSFLIKTHLRTFQKETKPSILEWISKTFEHFHKTLDQLTQQTVNIDSSFQKNLNHNIKNNNAEKTMVLWSSQPFSCQILLRILKSLSILKEE